MESPILSIGIIVYNSKKYFPYFFKSIFLQKEVKTEILVLDNTNGKSDDIEYINKYYPQIQCFKKDNIGFAKGHNFLINKSKGKYYACINPDMFFIEGFFSNIIREFSKNDKIGSISGKIFRWDYKNINNNFGRTFIIDTCGLDMKSPLQFIDIGQGNLDNGQYDNTTEIFGVSGAAAVYSKEALIDVSINKKNTVKEYFDEKMFMYKEDCDLAYRLQRKNWKSFFVPNAISYHDRTIKKPKNILTLISERKNRPIKIRKWSYENQKYIYKKYIKDFPLLSQLKILFRSFLEYVYLKIFEKEIFSINKDKKEIVNHNLT